MVMDKGLGLRAAQDMIEVAGKHIDFVKLGFGTSMVTGGLEDKIKLYKSNGLEPYLGGTLFEAFVVRNKFNEYKKLLKSLKVDTVEVSDGSIYLKPEDKVKYISDLAKDFRVLSEVGSKDSGIFIAPQKWKKLMQMELEAGAYKVIAEARESGTVGIYRPGGKPHVQLIKQILSVVDGDKIIWKDFGYENDYSGFDLEEFRNISPFVFDKKKYFAEFEIIAKELLDIPRKEAE